jgi:PKD repeat protein
MKRLVLACCVGLLVPVPARAADDLRVIVIDGDEAANIVADKLAAIPVIEVRDKDDRRVSGAVVRFAIRKTRDRLIAAFRNGQSEVRTLTDASGQASSSGITPLEPGSFEIDVDVRYPGQSGKAVIRQTNFRNVADAKAAGREPGKSTSSNAQPATTNAGTSTAATGATTTGATTAASTAATTATNATVAAGGGISKVAVIGLVAGGAAGAGAAVVMSQRKADRPAGSLGAVTASATSGMQAGTPFTFSVQATNFEASSLSFRWEFGDGATSVDPSPTHVYDTAGAFTVVVTVADARQSARSELSVRVQTLTGTWFNSAHFGGYTLMLTQSGSTIVGSETMGGQTCPVSGSVQRGSSEALLTGPVCPGTSPFGDLPPHAMRAFFLDDGTLRVVIDYQVIGRFNVVMVRR